jgi:ABC-type uncharacterized transport system ATPase subunit
MPVKDFPPAASAAPEAPVVEMRGIHKRFGSVHANRGVDFSVRRGSIHGIVGENGAGKSTLMSVLYGFHEADAGSILIDGKPVRLASAQDAIAHGIGMVHQHFMLVDRFTVLENIVLGAEQGMFIMPSLRRARSEIERLSREFGLAVDPDARVRDLPVGALQRVEILKALYRGARILILDEPTAVLTPQEADQLSGMLRQLKEKGATVIIITHKLNEIMAMTDQVTVMRAGTVVARCDTRSTSPEALAELMVGRCMAPSMAGQAQANANANANANAAPRVPRQLRLAVQGLGWRDAQGVPRLRDVSLELRAGEIVGVAGVSGNGQTELMLTLAGLITPHSGSIHVAKSDDTARVIDARHPGDPRELRELGVAHVPEDRHRLGLVLGFPAWESAALGYLHDPKIQRGPLLKPDVMRAQCRAMMQDFDVRPVDENLGSSKFSGGNQQKLVLAREFHHAPRVLLIGQPTRGVDIGAIELIHRRLRALRDAGCAVLLVSTELEEILALSDRIAVMCGGRVTGELMRAEATERRLGELMGEGAEVHQQHTDAEVAA